MLTFNLYTAGEYERSHRVVHIDPAAVVAVEESERRPAVGGWYQVAIITLATGDKYIVLDEARQAARQIADCARRSFGRASARPPNGGGKKTNGGAASVPPRWDRPAKSTPFAQVQPCRDGPPVSTCRGQSSRKHSRACIVVFNNSASFQVTTSA